MAWDGPPRTNTRQARPTSTRNCHSDFSSQSAVLIGRSRKLRGQFTNDLNILFTNEQEKIENVDLRSFLVYIIVVIKFPS